MMARSPLYISVLALLFCFHSYAEQRYVVKPKRSASLIARAIQRQALASGIQTMNLPIVKQTLSGAFVVRATAASIQQLQLTLGPEYEVLIDRIISIPEIQESGGSSGGATATTQVIPFGIRRIRSMEVPNYQGEGIVVCISDTGIDLDHPDLAANIIDDFSTINGVPTGDDDHFHGTHVAGTIAALNNEIGVIGIAPKAKLIAAKGLNSSGSGFEADLADTIDGCVARGAHIINMSWGSTTSSVLISAAISRAAAAGVVLIAAAGNNGGPVIFPAAQAEVVAVTAIDAQDVFASFSSFGNQVENTAPGVAILSTFPNGLFSTISGTSMAAPHVSGVAALMLSKSRAFTRNNLLGLSLGFAANQQGTRGLIDAYLTLKQ